jgi:hypothetical protein
LTETRKAEGESRKPKQLESGVGRVSKRRGKPKGKNQKGETGKKGKTYGEEPKKPAIITVAWRKKVLELEIAS